MNTIDAVLESVLARHHFSPLINSAIGAIANFNTFKGLVLVPLLWLLWFRDHERIQWRREIVVATTISGVLALLIGRILADCLPFRNRPINTAALHEHFVSIVHHDSVLPGWSSFPSDHAILWTSVAAGIYIMSRKLGVLAFLYTALFICAPRAYLGYHFPTDLLAGAAIGLAITFVMTRDAIRARYAPAILQYMERYRGASAVIAFVICVELATQFDELRKFGSSFSKML